MADIINETISTLRAASPSNYAAQLCAVCKDIRVDQRAFTDALLHATRIGSLSIYILVLWLSVTHDVTSIVKCLQQEDCQEACTVAIARFARALRHHDTFDAAWDAVGGTVGLVAVLDTLSVQHVYYLCRQLAKKPQILRQKRQQACRDLLEALCPENTETTGATDKRPLQDAYHPLILACDTDTALAWDDRIDVQLRKHLRSMHGDAFLQKSLDACFPASASAKVKQDDFACLVTLIRQNRSRYGLAALTRLAESQTIPEGLGAAELVGKLIMPIIKREPREGGRRIGCETSVSLWKAVAACFEKHPALGTNLDWLQEMLSPLAKPSLVLLRLVCDWGRFGGNPDHEACLTTFLRLLSFDQHVVQADMLRRAPQGLRYRLLRLFFQHASGFGLDIGELDEHPAAIPEAEARRLRLTLEIFFVLPPGEARLLAQRLLASDPDLKWIAADSGKNCRLGGPLSWKRSPSERDSDPYIRQAMLQSVTGATGGPDVAEELVRRKKRAQVGKAVEERTFWAKSAVFLSMAAGDLETYGATLDWAKRFAKDWHVYSALYTMNVVGAEEAADLLCVVPPKSLLAFSTFDTSTFTAAVNKANQILAFCIQQAMDGTREPGSTPVSWNVVFHLTTDVVYRRLANVNAWQDHFGISDVQVTDLLLRPTLDTVVDAERQLLTFQNPNLCCLARKTLYKRPTSSLGRLRAPSLVFLDSLAKARDGLWQVYRAQLDPRVASLGAPWPRGLPLHETVHVMADPPFVLPYMEERAKSIVFGDANVYLRSLDAVDDNTKDAVDNFVESWPKALSIYLGGTQDEERKRRIKSAWEYASGPLTEGRCLSRSEIRSFWTPIFQAAGAEIPRSDAGDDERITVLPSSDFPFSPLPSTWNPMNAPSLPAPVKDRKLERLCLDALLFAGRLDAVHTGHYPGVSGPELYWKLANSQKNIPQPVVDSYISTAALTLSTRYRAAPLLPSPFPSNNPSEIRFPVMNLDPTFTQYSESAHDALVVLQKFARQCPSALLSKLAGSLLDVVLQMSNDETSGYLANECLQNFVSVFKLLREKAPVAAGELAAKAVTDLSRDSSWHRSLINAGLLRRLPPSQAEKTLRDLLEGLLQQRSKERYPVKITTIKLVAQVLKNNPAVSTDYAVGMLTRLFRVSEHVDVYIEASRSLIDTAQSLPDSASSVQQQVIEALTTYVVTRAGSLDENQQKRDALTEEEWRSMEEGNALMPEVWDNEREQSPVLLQLLIDACSETRPSDKHGHPGHTDRHPRLHFALLPLLEAALRENGRLHRRWLEAFLVRENLATWPEVDALLPAVPVYFEGMMVSVFNAGLLTQGLFRVMVQHVLQSIEPPAALAGITARVDADPKLRNSPAGKHWLRMWKKCKGSTVLEKLGGRWAASTLLSKTSTPDPLLINGGVDMLADFVHDMAFAFLRTSDATSLRMLVGILVHGERVAWKASDSALHRGRGKGLDLLHQLAAETDRIRNQPAWRQNPDRQPATLPDSFEWKLKIWQCSLPYKRPKLVAWDDRVLSGLVESTVQLVKGLVEESNAPYHLGIERLNNWFFSAGGDQQSSPNLSIMSFAIALGSIDPARHRIEENSLVRCLCADLSCSYLTAAATKNKTKTTGTGTANSWCDSTPQVEAMVATWMRSDVDFLWSRAQMVIGKEGGW